MAARRSRPCRPLHLTPGRGTGGAGCISQRPAPAEADRDGADRDGTERHCDPRHAFSTQWTRLSGLLASTARTYFGLNQAWNIGIAGQSAGYFSAPANASGSELAQEAFGEGELLASPLAMASVAATVDTGTFRQPYLLPGTPQVTATALVMDAGYGAQYAGVEVKAFLSRY